MAGLAVVAGAFAGTALARAESGKQTQSPPSHTSPAPGLASGKSKKDQAKSLRLGPELERGGSVREMLEQRRRLDAALAAIPTQRPGVVDAYVIAIALDSDPVFAREARAAAKVLARRYDAAGRTLVLAGPDGRSGDEHPKGSITALTLALARMAEVMDTSEDVLILYTTSHGTPHGLSYHYGDTGYGVLAPARLKQVLEELQIRRRLLMISACFSGIFVPALKSNDTAILTASAANRASFGCASENDWTFFGDALINRALRKDQGLAEALDEASLLIAEWEAKRRFVSSLPQRFIGKDATLWLDALAQRRPLTATAPTGRLTDAQ